MYPTEIGIVGLVVLDREERQILREVLHRSELTLSAFRTRYEATLTIADDAHLTESMAAFHQHTRYTLHLIVPLITLHAVHLKSYS